MKLTIFEILFNHHHKVAFTNIKCQLNHKSSFKPIWLLKTIRHSTWISKLNPKKSCIKLAKNSKFYPKKCKYVVLFIIIFFENKLIERLFDYFIAIPRNDYKFIDHTTLLCPKHEFCILHNGFHLVEKINLWSSTWEGCKRYRWMKPCFIISSKFPFAFRDCI
jgi:hypothetical protein